MRRLTLFLVPLAMFTAGCSSDKSTDDAGTPDTGVKLDGGVDAGGKDSGITDAAADAAKLDGYYVWGHTGAMNRLYIYYADQQNDLCFALYFKAGTNMTAVTVPMGWNLETIGTGVFHSAQACTPYYSGTADYMQNLSSSGSVNWSGMNVPGTVWDVNVTLNFMPSWAPGSFDMKAMNLNVIMF